MNLIFGGHWKQHEDGWEILTEKDQDITAPLKFNDNSVNAIFTEHVIEHVNLCQGIFFLKEAFRILKPGGILRTVAP
jgi:predicted SAM-dependent methyltransferase